MEKLKQKIKERGLRTDFVRKQLNLTPSEWCKRIHRRVRWSGREVIILSEILNLTLTEQRAIFIDD